MAVFCLHDQEKETFELAHLLGVLRSDMDFGRDYDARLDELLAENKLWVRHPMDFWERLRNHSPQVPGCRRWWAYIGS